MPVRSAANSPCRPFSPERGGFTVEQARANLQAFEVKASIIFYIINMLVLSFIHGVDPKALFYVSLKYTILTVALVFGIICCKHSDGILFIYFKRPYDIGDLIEFDPPESSVSPNARKTWRVDCVTLFHTDFVNLFNNRPCTWCNKRLANRRMINWSRRPTTFQIILQVPVDTCDDVLPVLLQDFREKIEHYANDNPSEWSAVECNDKAIVVGNEYKEYCIEIRHRESWHELGQVYSKANLITYCQILVGELENKEPAKRHGSALPAGFGCNDEDGGDNTNNNKENDMGNDQNKKNDGANIGNTLEDGEQEEGDGEEDENDNDDVRRMNYRIFVR